jgi:hypothetical protein
VKHSSIENKIVRTGYTPRPLQAQIHNEIKRFSVLVCHRRFGKCLDVTTPIPTPDRGYVPIGELQAGDFVFDELGKPTKVVAAHPFLYNLKCYELTFSDGATVVCDSEHLWFTQTKLDRTARDRTKRARVSKNHGVLQPKAGSVKTTQEIVDSLQYMGESNHAVPVCGALEYPEQLLPIDPYILGIWLGDGTSRRPEFTTMDVEILFAMQKYASENGLTLRATKNQNAGRATTYRLTGGLQELLRKEKLLNNKHIPEIYLRGSVAQRVALLQGLMDTDGTISKNGHCDITQKRPELTTAITSILSSLGMKHTVTKRTVRGRVYERVTFTPNLNPFRLSRKAERFKSVAKVTHTRYIVSAKEVPSRPVRCIEVANKSHLFLCSKWNIPTHNTVLAIAELVDRGLRNLMKNPQYAYFAPFHGQAKRVAWEYLKDFTKNIPGVVINEAELRVDIPRPSMGDKIRFLLLGADNPASILGMYFDGIILDEFAEMDPQIWTRILRPTLSDRRGWSLFIGTPRGQNHFYDVLNIAKENKTGEWYWKLFKASETNIVPASELAEAKNTMAPEEYDQEFECSFTAALVGAFYGKEMEAALHEGRIGKVPYDPARPVFTSWDLGMDDTTAIWFLQHIGREYRAIDYVEDSGRGLDYYAKILKEKRYYYEDHYMPHDTAARELGTGKSRQETLRTLGVHPIRIGPRQKVDDRINAARLIIPRMWFDAEKCKRGIAALQNYERKWDAKNKIYSSAPLHNWASHGADAFGEYALQSRDNSTKERMSQLPRRALTDYNVFDS